MIGLSPLPPAHPSTFQRKPVRPSSACHGAFSLAGGRSQSFASAAADSSALFGHAFAPGPGVNALTLAGDERLVGSLCKRHAVTPYGAPTACGRTVSGSVSLRCPRCFSPFPHGTCALSVSREYLALADGAAGFGQGSSGPALLRCRLGFKRIVHKGLSPAMARLSRHVPLCVLLPLVAGPTTPRAPRRPRFGLFPFRSPLLGESLFVFLSSAT